MSAQTLFGVSLSRDVAMQRLYFALTNIFVVINLFLLNACNSRPQGISLPFETIEQQESPGTGEPYETTEPGIRMVTSAEEIDALNGWISVEAQAQLQNVNYEQYVVLAVFQGLKPTTRYSVEIKRITRLGDTVNVHVQFQEPKPNEMSGDAITSPYHVVQMQKVGEWGQDITYQLVEMSPSSLSDIATQVAASPTLNAPYPPPPNKPTPSVAAQTAVAYIAQHEGIPAERLQITYDSPTTYPDGREFQLVGLQDTPPNGQTQQYRVLVDLATGQVDAELSAWLTLEAQAPQMYNGKLAPALIQKLQPLAAAELVPVRVWLVLQPDQMQTIQEAALAAMATKYPTAQLTLNVSGQLGVVAAPELVDQISADYLALIETALQAHVQPLAAELEKQGYPGRIVKGMAAFEVVLPKHIILELTNHEAVSMLYLLDNQE